ncbi:aminoglycoside phosphotransferase [Paenibacillus ginsengarvi]|uniref:Aminoglycoside phosphotransferase n=2 Tax=Paenibacillus ginsengarvi TaxID=400777 RepID=A0A3B0BI95_9BACL|nr:aminoglycoside phosphotransferase [Paenibacillus ginsengarvi]
MREQEQGQEHEQGLFRQLLGEPIEDVLVLDPGYSGHASDVWLVKTPSREVVVRSSRMSGEPEGEFWLGCKLLFGIDPRRMEFMESSAKLLNGIATIPAPKTLAKRTIGDKQYLVVEKMEGVPLRRFADLPDEALYTFGCWLAEVHSHSFEVFGNLADAPNEPKARFHERMLATMEHLVQSEHGDSPEMNETLAAVKAEMAHLREPETCAPVLVDMDPSQFLALGGRITSIVDTEAYVLAPPELDFIGLEYVLDARSARPVLAGYASVRNVPDLSVVRRPYRFLYRLLGVQGSVPLADWFAHPEWLEGAQNDG